jgi:phosphomannomutase
VAEWHIWQVEWKSKNTLPPLRRKLELFNIKLKFVKNMIHKFHPSILRAYDIRGIVGETLTVKDAYYVGRSLATYLHENNKNKVVIGYDGRISSPDLKDSLIQGLIDSGMNVTDIGVGPTPMLYFGIYHLKADAGIMVTGSHNPPSHNGFKIMLKDYPFYGDDIIKLGKIAEEGQFIEKEGKITEQNIIDDYVNRIVSDSDIASEGEFADEVDDFLTDEERQLRVAWDAGNGAAGEVMKRISKKTKAKDFLLYEDIDGTFPNHHPDPTVPENLEDLRRAVLDNNCDLGIAFDGDGDRIGVIDNEGEIIWPDQLMILFAREVLGEYPGATIIGDVKASQVLFDEITKAGGKALMWKTGHSLIKAKMKETKSPLAGEMSGHIFFADKYYGFDDGLYAAIRIMNIVIGSQKPLSEIRKSLPKTFSTPEIRIECDEEEKFLIIEKLKKQLKNENISFNDIDGIRTKNADGWWLLRASNTQAVLVARCESYSEDGLERLKNDLSARLGKKIL